VNRSRRYIVSLIAVLLLVALSLVGLFVLNAKPKLGLDLQGGLSVVLTARGEVEPGVLEQTVEIIRNRVDSLGAQEPDISTSGEENIVVQLPGIRDADRALELIGRTAQLRFREVLEAADLSEAQAAARKKKLEPGTDRFDAEVAKFMKSKGVELTRDDPVDEEVVFADAERGDVWYRLGKAEVLGSHIDRAQATFDTAGGSGWSVTLDLNGEGTKAFGDVTTRLSATQGQLAIVLDQRVESAPQVSDPIPDGEAQITGQFREQEAKDLALVLQTGALPIELEQSQVERVSATLGTASLRAGLIAGAIGLSLVAVYMFVFYRWLGLINLVGLTIFNVLLLGIIGAISTYRGFSLTLAGIAGMIVSLGVAADTYIIYFERLKEDIGLGKTFRSATQSAYRSAMRTNIAANTVAGGAALILYLGAVGPVRGFALTLGISVVLDIFLLYLYTHPIVSLLAFRGKMSAGRAMGATKQMEAAAAS
jgi:preprotein translocase subunit SecD